MIPREGVDDGFTHASMVSLPRFSSGTGEGISTHCPLLKVIPPPVGRTASKTMPDELFGRGMALLARLASGLRPSKPTSKVGPDFNPSGYSTVRVLTGAENIARVGPGPAEAITRSS